MMINDPSHPDTTTTTRQSGGGGSIIKAQGEDKEGQQQTLFFPLNVKSIVLFVGVCFTLVSQNIELQHVLGDTRPLQRIIATEYQLPPSSRALDVKQQEQQQHQRRPKFDNNSSSSGHHHPLLGGGESLESSNNNNNNNKPQPPPQAHNNNRRSRPKPKPKPLKIAIYMTTHLSESHKKCLQDCWAMAIKRLPLLSQSDLIVYTSASSQYDYLYYNLMKKTTKQPGTTTSSGAATTAGGGLGFGFNNVTIYRYDPLDYQEGATLAMIDPFYQRPQRQHKQQQRNQNETNTNNDYDHYYDDISSYKTRSPHGGWFDGYDWIVRLNPDVLIRTDQKLFEIFYNHNMDAIFTSPKWCNGKALFSDFYAFRPSAANQTALLETFLQMKRHGNSSEVVFEFLNAENHLYKGFESIVNEGTKRRWTQLPDCRGKNGKARIMGNNCDVVHNHELIKHCPNYFEATDGKWY